MKVFVFKYYHRFPWPNPLEHRTHIIACKNDAVYCVQNMYVPHAREPAMWSEVKWKIVRVKRYKSSVSIVMSVFHDDMTKSWASL